MTEIKKMFNEGTVLFKNALFFFMGIVAMVTFYINTSSHVDNTEIHVDQSAKVEMILLVQRVETLSERSDKRYKRTTEELEELHRVYEKIIDLLKQIEGGVDGRD